MEKTEKIRITKLKHILSEYSIYFVLLLMVIIMSFATNTFLTKSNILNVLVSEAGRGILALGAGLVIISKGIDLSVGSVVSLSAVVSASLVQQSTYTSPILPNLGFVPLWTAILAGLAVGAAVGLFNGLIVAYCRVPAFIATLGGMVIAQGLALTYTNSYPVPMLRDTYTMFGKIKVLGIPISILYFIGMAFILWIVLNKTRFGKNVYAIGGNDSAAEVAGVNVRLNTTMVYVCNGVMAAFVGIILAARTGSAIATLGDGYELDAIAAAIVGGVSNNGGVGTVGGMVAGVLILGILNNGMLLLGISAYAQQIIKGFIIIIAVVFGVQKSKVKK